MEQKRKFSLLSKILGVFAVLFVIFILIKILVPLGSATIQIKATENSINKASTGGYLDAEFPIKSGKITHITRVDMPESGFIAVYRPYQSYIDGKPIDTKLLGTSVLLPKGIKENFDILLSEDVVGCTALTVQLFKDVNGDGKIDFSAQGAGGEEKVNMEAWIPNPNDRYPGSSVMQNLNVNCGR